MAARAQRRTTRWDLFSAWFTSGDLGEQGCWAARQVGVEPDVVIDVGAGAGGICSRVRHVWPDARVVAIEVRGEERKHLERWADDVLICDFRELRPDHPALRGKRRLVLGNPPYGPSDDDEPDDLTTQTLRWAFGLLTPLDWIHFLLRKSYEEGEEASRFFRAEEEGGFSPVADFRIPSRANFRRGVNGAGKPLSGDFIGHRWVTWRPGCHRWFWRSATLPLLPASSMSWATRPGTEPVAGRLYPGFRPRFPTLEEVVG